MKEIRFKKSDTVKVIAELASYIDSLKEDKDYSLTVKEYKEKSQKTFREIRLSCSSLR